ncbi:DUF3991 and toprim domain-containing protein [Gluconacetobacter sp.]|uniref:DUF3991 and toprim domain-containing protein n=1 Tax=Gluconacetobacter sp. TaxID=1935994 RepID=UPI0039ED4C8B
MARFELSDEDRSTIVSGVPCAVLLERHGYALDRRESTRNCLKYRAGKGDTIIVNHEGRGWWDTGSDKKGDVFDLIRRLEPDLGWRDACAELGRLVGVEPEGAVYVRQREAASGADVAPSLRWERCGELASGSQAWTYLTVQRALPEWVVRRAAAAGVIRDGLHAAWFCHRDAHGQVCGVELRGPERHLCLKGTVKTLFRYMPGGAPIVRRLVVTEAAINALSFAALDGGRTVDTLYTSTAGGMGPETEEAIRAHLRAMAGKSGVGLVIATDNDQAGDRYAARLSAIADEIGVPWSRELPAWGMNDFNDVLRRVVAERAAAA